MQEDQAWFASFRKTPEYDRFLQQPVAYFSAEYAISPRLPVYAGGLGVLAGDMVKEACDQTFPMVGVGLFYREGYTRQKIDEQGKIVSANVIINPQEAGLTQVLDAEGKRVTVNVPVHDRTVVVCAWSWQQGTVPVYLMDTDVEENNASDRTITSSLYALDKETRLKQEMILGIGGIRFLEALRIHPSVYHLNEGHSAILILDLVRHEMEKRQVSFRDAVALAKRHIIFTNHTLISSGHEVFSNDLVSTMLAKYAEEISIPAQDIVELGLVQESSKFSMTMLSLRSSAKSNAVSKLHEKKALEIWSDHPMEVITNGIHVPSWDGGSNREGLWDHHAQGKLVLLEYIKEQTGVVWPENELLIGWARRIVSYKRPLALFADLERFRTLATNPEAPIHVVISGFSPPGDGQGAKILEEIQEYASSTLKGTVVYLPNYDLKVARILVTGCDVWLNTPVVGFEASGTSGMKAALNGDLPLSTKDGWVDEAELFGVGWIIDNDQITQSLLDTLEKSVLPMYYAKPTPHPEWVSHMQNSYDMVVNQFSSTRMLRNYIERMYLPILQAIGH